MMEFLTLARHLIIATDDYEGICSLLKIEISDSYILSLYLLDDLQNDSFYSHTLFSATLKVIWRTSTGLIPKNHGKRCTVSSSMCTIIGKLTKKPPTAESIELVRYVLSLPSGQEEFEIIMKRDPAWKLKDMLAVDSTAYQLARFAFRQGKLKLFLEVINLDGFKREYIMHLDKEK